MKAKKFLAILLASTMVMSLVACGSTATDETADASVSEETVEDTEVAAAPAAVTIENPSTDFSDGLFGFVGSDKVVNPNADSSVFSVAEFNGEAALKVEAQGSAPYVAIQMDAMVGDKLADVDSVAVTIGIESADGNFYAASGNVYSVIAGEKAGNTGWSIYKADANPKTYVHKIGTTAAEGDYVVVSMESDVAVADAGIAQTTMYILDITFMDADGNTIDVDTSAEFVAASTGVDRSNLFGIAGAVTVDLAGSGDGWSQIGYQDLTDEEWEALTTPGSVVEIAYASETGNMWMGLSGDAWTRLGVGDCDGSGQGYAYYNNSRTIAQITYEEIASVLGDDTSAWDKQIFLESDGAFEVFSVQIGQQAPSLVLTNGIDIGVSGKGDGWSQIGYIDIPEDAYEVLKTPGSLVKIEYSADTDDLWMGLSGDNWQRVGVGNADGSGTVDAITDGSVCYVTYDMIAEICGDDTSAWDKQIFIESDGAFEVYSVTIGMAGEFIPINKLVAFEGYAPKGDAWSQDGLEMPQEIVDALVPGSVLSISYASETNNLWIVMAWAEAGWMRVGVGDCDGSGQGYAISDGTTCQIPYEMIAEYCGDDVATWGAMLQCESDGAWEVYSLSVGQSAQ